MSNWLHQETEPAANVFRGNDIPKAFSRFTLLGQYENQEGRFVRHAALLALPSNLPATVAVFHMGPPLVSTSAALSIETDDRELFPDLAFDLRLSEEEETLVTRWASKIANESGSLDERRYVIRPHVNLRLNERGAVQYHRFSCAGYAIEAFRSANINLCNKENLPMISIELLRPTYPLIDEIISRPKLRKHYGVEEDPPWPVLMPAYLFYGADHREQQKVGSFNVPHLLAESFVSYPAADKGS
ncbi:MAG: hypothetical protein MUC83_10510 [Pirellula sp.]|nr:hypothetical protein [Pirellula sp.]